MRLTAFLAFATLGLAADNSVISLFIPDTDPQPLEGTVLGENSSTTTYSINCPPDTDSSQCGMGPGLYLTTARSSVEYLITDGPNDIYNHVVCSMTDPSSAVRTCTGTVTGKNVSMPGTSTSTLNQDQVTSLPVTITSNKAANLTAGILSSATGSEASLQSSTALPTGGVSINEGSVLDKAHLTTLLLACAAVQALAASL